VSLQVELAPCPCRRCPWKLRSKCSHYADVCLEMRCCSNCKYPLEECVKEASV